MITEKVILKSSLQYSDDKRKRYVLSVEWDKDRKKACVIMLSSGQANGMVFDRTTTHCIENLIELDYGGTEKDLNKIAHLPISDKAFQFRICKETRSERV